MAYVGRGLTTGAQYQKLDTITIDNATTFTMQVDGTAVTPAPEHLILAVNGVIQEPNVGFTLSGSTCTLASAIDNDGGSDTIWGMIAGDAAFAASSTINEDRLQISNAGSNGQFLSKQSGNTGGLTWATVTDTNTMGSGFTVSATTDNNPTIITQGDDLMFTAGTGITCETTADGTVTITNTVTNTNDDVSVANLQTALASLDGDDTTYVGDSGDDTTFVIRGTLQVDGTTTTINTATVEVEDNILQLNTTQASPDTATATTSGITVYRGDGVTQASLIFDDADDTWDLTNNLKVAGSVQSGDLILKSPTNKGHYTIWEEEEYLAIKNENTGKKYKFVLEEIDE